MKEGCTNKESHICSNPNCHTRLCQKCVLEYPEDGLLDIDPPEDKIADEHAQMEGSVDLE